MRKFVIVGLFWSALSFAGQITFNGTFNGAGGSGTVDGLNWLVSTEGSDLVWSIPGFQDGLTTWAGSSSVIGFDLTITSNIGQTVTIDNSISPSCSSGAGLVMSNGGCSNIWTPNPSANSVGFTPPGGDSLAPGGTFFVNVPFLTTGGAVEVAALDGAAVATYSFNGAFITTAPEPATIALVSAALGLLFFLRRR